MDKDSEQMLLEVLKMARELVINEYVDRRAQDHNTWLYESENLWRTRRMKLQYPTIPPYPTEREIVERAQTLLKFLILGNRPAREHVDISLPTELPKEEIQEIVKPVTIEEPSLPQIVEESLPTLPIPEVEIKEEPSGRILPSVLKKIEQIRNRF